jgi:hypothetical protein
MLFQLINLEEILMDWQNFLKINAIKPQVHVEVLREKK